MNTRQAVVTFALIHVGIFMGIFMLWSHQFYIGTGELEQFWALKLLDGQVPYRDFEIEYPPLVLLTFIIPALVATSLNGYIWVFAAEMTVLGLAAMALVAALATRLQISVWRALTVYTLAILAIGPLAIGRYDLLPAALTMAALYAFVTRRDKLAWGMLALGVAAKAYPLIIAPLFILYYVRRREYARLLQGAAAFAVVILAISLPFIWISPEGFWQTINYHAERGLHSESTYASILLVGNVLGLTHVEGVFNFGSWNIASSLADSLADISPYIMVVLLAAIYALYARALWRYEDAGKDRGFLSPEAAGRIIHYSTLVVFAFLLTSKVFSPQFLIWLAPLLPLVNVPWRNVWLWIFLVMGGLTQYIYPHHYLEFEMGYPYLIAILASRNTLLAVMALFLVEWRARPAHRPADVPVGT